MKAGGMLLQSFESLEPFLYCFIFKQHNERARFPHAFGGVITVYKVLPAGLAIRGIDRRTVVRTPS